MDAQTLERGQEEILSELSEIRAMKRGTVTHQRMRIRGRPKGEAVCGPYPVLTWKEAGQTRSLRLRVPDEVAWAEQAIGNYRRFAVLCREYEHLGELRALGQRPGVESASDQARKKGRKSRRSSRAK
jgi:hypothetical protein